MGKKAGNIKETLGDDLQVRPQGLPPFFWFLDFWRFLAAARNRTVFAYEFFSPRPPVIFGQPESQRAGVYSLVFCCHLFCILAFQEFKFCH